MYCVLREAARTTEMHRAGKTGDAKLTEEGADGVSS